MFLIEIQISGAFWFKDDLNLVDDNLSHLKNTKDNEDDKRTTTKN
jgi:hypothetical protein